MSSHNWPFEGHGSSLQIVDPGDAATITVDRQLGTVALVSAGAETRTLGRPTQQGVLCLLHHHTDGGAITLTVTGGFDEAGNTALTFDDVGEFALFAAVYDGTDYSWRLVKAAEGMLASAIVSASATQLFSPAGTEKWRIDSTGNLSSAGAPANVTADGAVLATGGIAFTDVLNAWIDDATHGTGTTTIYIGNQTITTSSDSRVKTDIETYEGSALDVLAASPRLVTFRYNLPGGGDVNERGVFYGYIAQETIQAFPWVVNDNGGKDCPKCLAGDPCDEHGAWHVSYEHLVPLLVRAVNELREMVDALLPSSRPKKKKE